MPSVLQDSGVKTAKAPVAPDLEAKEIKVRVTGGPERQLRRLAPPQSRGGGVETMGTRGMDTKAATPAPTAIALTRIPGTRLSSPHAACSDPG
jgi:hypothetical protein